MSQNTNGTQTINLFGVEMAPTPSVPRAGASSVGDSTDRISNVLQEATAEIQATLDRDLSGQASYSISTPGQPMAAGATFTTSSSVFRDSGLPRIQNLSRFVEEVIPKFAADGTVPFFELNDNSVGHIWGARNNLQRNRSRRSFGNLFRFLTRMRWRDSEEWQGLRSERWAAQHRGPLAFYMTELFAGRFVDRNGTAKTFSLGVDFTDLAQVSSIELSPELAGKIVGTFVEFLGDRVFQVPYYAPNLLNHFKSHRTLEAAITKNESNVELIKAAIRSGVLDSTTAEELGLPVEGNLDWSVLFKPSVGNEETPESPESTSTIIGSRACRLLVQKMDSLDSTFHSQSTALSASEKEIAAIFNGSSKLQSRYTVHAAGIQTNAMRCIFLPEESESCGTASIGGEKDYSDLVGKLVKLAGESAERNVRALIGGVVRGISLFALDNEVVAEVVSASASVASKKAAEAFTYSLITRFIADQSIPLVTRKDTLARWSAIHQRLDGE